MQRMQGKEAVGFLKLASHLVGSCLMEVLGTELSSSGRASNAVTTESSFYPLLFVFSQINPIVNYHCLSVKMVKIKRVTHQTLANFTVTEFLINCGWGCKMSQPPVLATFGCQLDCIWNGVKPKLLGTPMRTFFLLKWEVPLLIQVFQGGKTNL